MNRNDPNQAYLRKALLLVTTLALLGAACLLWIMLQGTDGSQERLVAEIYQDGRLLQTIDLSAVETPYAFIISGEAGAFNVIEVRPGSIGILSASCPDKLCVHQGFLSNSLLPITCLPNRLVIQVRQETEETEKETLDMISY